MACWAVMKFFEFVKCQIIAYTVWNETLPVSGSLRMEMRFSAGTEVSSGHVGV